MRVTLLQIEVRDEEPLPERVDRVAALVAEQSDTDLVVLPELWPHGAFASGRWAAEAEPLDGPVVTALRAAAKAFGGHLHAGSLVERDQAGRLYNCSVLLGPDGATVATYRKIHRFGFTEGEARLVDRGDQPVTVALPATRLGLATCYDLRFPELFRLLVDAGAQTLCVPAGWPAARLEHWRLLLRARAVESQAYVLGCGTAGSHAGVAMAGHSMVVDPWGEVLAEAGAGAQALTVELDPGQVARVRAEFPVLRDRVLGLPAPG